MTEPKKPALTVVADWLTGNKAGVELYIGAPGASYGAMMWVERGSDVPGQADTRPSRIIIECPAEIAENVASELRIQCFPAPPRDGLFHEVFAVMARIQREIDELKGRA